ncbi:MAG: sulfurtransferase TusA family protein [Pseudomonadales bacterium]|nr:sulfurtransferase TusA family protein [Pseudomonadales bacterium]
MSSFDLDVRRLLCPMPVIKTQDRIKELEPGDQLAVYCTDPGVLEDIPTWCRINGHTVLTSESNDQEICITIEVEAPQ